MMVLGWYVALIIWLLGMWLAYRVNQAIIEIEYRELMDEDAMFFMLVCLYSLLTILLWPLVQLIAMQMAFSRTGEHEEET